MIEFLDVKAMNSSTQMAVEEALLRVARSKRYILGPEVERFEAEWARYCGADHCIGVGNALDGLRLILLAHGVGPGDEVIVPSNTYIATWLAASSIGALPVPVEPDPRTFNLDPSRVLEAVTGRTKAIIAVHLYGRPADMAPLVELAGLQGLLLVEDCAQAHAAWSDGQMCGTFGHAAAFSFYPTKNLGALGDAGAVLCKDGAAADRIRRMRSYGGGHLYGRLDHEVPGLNSRLDELQAAVLLAKLPHLHAITLDRRARAACYRAALRDAMAVLPEDVPGHVYHQFVVRVDDRDAVRARMREAGVDCHVHYPIPPHKERAFAALECERQPIAEMLAGDILSLPIGYWVDVRAVARALEEAAGTVHA